MTHPDFVHLHVHSEYSLLDGANRISDLVAACQQDGQGAIALTDHGNMFGAMELYQKCVAGGVKPILGCEVYIARDSRFKPHHRVHNGYNHLTLLARNEEGYRNLLKLASLSFVEGYHFRPRIDKELLHRYAGGISCLSGCLSGELNQFFINDKENEAEALAAEFRDLFGPEHFWLELQRNGINIQDKANEGMVRLHQRTGIPLVATNDIHYLRHEDCAAQDVLLCINTGARRSDEGRFKMDTDTLFFRTREEMGHTFRDLPESLVQTMVVAEQVNLEVEFGNYHLPIFDPVGETPSEMFDRLCDEGLALLYPNDAGEARKRLEYEKGVIREMGFESYFLIVWDLIKWARDNDIPVGPGRGSAAGSIVAYVLDIVRVDPLKYDLLFERFLNSARVSMPDIDIDFCKEGRERVLEYTRQRYGADHVAQIATFGTMASRTVVRDVGRVLDIPLGEIASIAKKVPAGPGAPPLSKALESDPDLVAIQKEKPELTELFDLSTRLEGMARHVSTHAAGVVIADKPIDNYVPLCTTGDLVSTQWPAGQLEDLGLLKMDYLGLRTLTILERSLRNIRAQGGEAPDLFDLPQGDPATYRMLQAGDTQGVFQLESEGMRRLLAKLKPDCFEDLIAVLALFRPGPLETGMADMFIRRKHGQEEIEYPHELLSTILADTYGCIVYQEQVMLISSELANFSLNEADNLRKAMGKKKPEIMEKFSQQFLDGAESNGCARKIAQEIWDNIVKFGGYGFNKSHSTAYAMITYQTAYLKANHRTAFLAGNMSCEMHDSDKIKGFIDDAKKSEIEVLPPDLRLSGWEFIPCAEKQIRFGLGAIKGTGQKAVEIILQARDADPELQSLHELCSAVDPSEVNRTTWEALIKAGCFDFTGHNRGAVLHGLDTALTEGARAASDRKSGQGSLFGAAEVVEESSGDGIDDRYAHDDRETLRAEYEVLGFYLSGHPLEERAGLFKILSTTTTKDLQELPGGSQITIAGLILQLKEAITKKGHKMARFRLEDLEGGVDVTVFPRTYEESKQWLADDTLVVCRGKLEEKLEDEGTTQPALILDAAMPIETALEDFDGALLIRLGPEDTDHLSGLNQILTQHPGARQVYFEVQGADGYLRRVRAGSERRVHINAQLANGVGALLGDGKVRLARI